MTDPYDRLDLGRDSSGRPIVLNARTKQMFDIVQEALDGRLVIVQGSYRPVSDASADTHVGGGALDVRTWNLTDRQRDRALRRARMIGFAAWYRTRAQGFDPHMHWIALGDRELSPGAARQERDYRAGLNGLANRGRDDFWRPDPIPTYEYREEDMPLSDDDIRKIAKAAGREAAEQVWREVLVERDPSTETDEKSAARLLAETHNRAGRALRDVGEDA